MNNTQEVLNVKVRLIFLLGNHHNKTKGNKSYHLFIIHYFADKLIISNIRSTNYRTDTQIVTKKAMKSIIHSIKASKDGKGNDEEADRRSATADVANPRPRKVGGACRIVLPALRFLNNLHVELLAILLIINSLRGYMKVRLPIFSCNLSLTFLANMLCVSVLDDTRRARLFNFFPSAIPNYIGKY